MAHPHQDTSSEVGVASVITPLSIRRGVGGEADCSFVLFHSDIFSYLFYPKSLDNQYFFIYLRHL